MFSRVAPVREALDRWAEKDLLPAAQIEALRAEIEEEAERGGQRLARLAVAGTGVVVLVIAAGVLGEWLWPRLGPQGQTIALILVGLAIYGAGLGVEGLKRWLPVTYLLQTAGLGVVLTALFNSNLVWDRQSPGAVIAGVFALLVPLVTVPVSVRRNDVMPAMTTALGFGFVAVFLNRVTLLSGDAILWILDGIMAALVAVVAWGLSRVRDRDGAEWLLNGLVLALYVALILMLATAAGPLDLDDEAFWAVDVWLLIVAGLCLWGVHRAPPAVQRDWFDNQLALCVVVAIPMGFYTTLELLDTGPEGAAALVAGIGVMGLAYAVQYRVASVLAVSSLALVLAAWYYGVERAGALGAVLALGFTAGLLIWIAVRMGRSEEKPRGA
ncbi:MAG TPA: hypothetical protein VGA70_03085 [Longimicrobiales bacterium]|jgi:hypothetical protein